MRANKFCTNHVIKTLGQIIDIKFETAYSSVTTSSLLNTSEHVINADVNNNIKSINEILPLLSEYM